MTDASEPIVVTISHRLGRDEVKRRLDDGLSQILRRLTPFASSIDCRWAGYRLGFGMTVLGQRIIGQIDVEDYLLRIELGLPLLPRLLSGTIIRRVRREVSRLLDKPASKPGPP